MWTPESVLSVIYMNMQLIIVFTTAHCPQITIINMQNCLHTDECLSLVNLMWISWHSCILSLLFFIINKHICMYFLFTHIQNSYSLSSWKNHIWGSTRKTKRSKWKFTRLYFIYRFGSWYYNCRRRTLQLLFISMVLIVIFWFFFFFLGYIYLFFYLRTGLMTYGVRNMRDSDVTHGPSWRSV